MLRLKLALSVIGLAVGAGVTAAEPIRLQVAYAYPGTFKDMQGVIAERFIREHPDIAIDFLAPAKDYEELVQQTLRAGLRGELPDVALHGLHRVRLLAERELVAPLDPLIAAEKGWDGMGYLPSMLDLAEHDGKVYGLPFAVSVPIVYYNADLVRRAGGNPEAFPSTWEGIVDLGRRIDSLGPDASGLYFEYYAANNNWTFHALVQSHGGQMMEADESRLAFDGDAGMAALGVLREIGAAGMVDMPDAQAYSAFGAGTLGILVASSSRITQVEKAAGGRFPVRTALFPIPAAEGRLPAGGNAAMIHARDPERQRAAWAYVKFATGPIGQTIMVEHSGYLPSNTLPINRPDQLGTFYGSHPNHRTPVAHMPLLTKFYTFPGEHSVRIPTVIRDHLQTVVSLKGAPEQAMATMTREVEALLPAR